MASAIRNRTPGVKFLCVVAQTSSFFNFEYRMARVSEVGNWILKVRVEQILVLGRVSVRVPLWSALLCGTLGEICLLFTPRGGNTIKISVLLWLKLNLSC